MYKELIQLNNKKNPIKIKRRTEQSFFQGRHRNGQQVYEKMLRTALLLIEMQMETTIIYHLTPVRMAIMKKKKTHKREDLERMWRKGNPCTLLVRV